MERLKKILTPLIVCYAVILIALALAGAFVVTQYVNNSEHGSGSNTVVVSDCDENQIARWANANHLNRYGDAEDIMYTGGTPSGIFNGTTGEQHTYCEYMLTKFPGKPWKSH